MDAIRSDIALVQVRLRVGYPVLGRRIGDVAIHLIQIRFEDLGYSRGVPEACGANEGLIGGTQTQELGDYGVPVVFDTLNGYAQTPPVIFPAASTVPVSLACPRS